MPNHFHMVVWPTEDAQLADFMHLMTCTHGRRWHVWRETVGNGAVYQSRYKAFPVQSDRHFLTVCRYVERNPLRAGLVGRAEDWPWSSLAAAAALSTAVSLHPWPVPRPPDWLAFVNESDVPRDTDRVRRSVRRGLPLGDPAWTTHTVDRLGLEQSTRPPGRPRKPQLPDRGIQP